MASIRIKQTAGEKSSYFYQIREGRGENEKNIAYKSGFKTREEAEYEANKVLKIWELDTYGITPKTHLIDLVRYYRKLRLNNRNLSVGTLKGYDIFEKLIEKHFDMPINTIKASYYQKVFTELGETKGKTYLERIDSYIRQSLELARGDDVRFKDFTFGLEIGSRKKPKKSDDKYIQKSKDIERLERRLFQKASETYYGAQKETSAYLVLYFLLATGMRYGELIALTWDDLQVTKEGKWEFNIHRRLLVQSDEFVPLKSEASYRQVPITTGQANLLIGLKELQDIMNEEHDVTNGRNLIFQHYRFKHDVPFSNAINVILSQVLHELNIEETITVYGLRHSRAAYLLDHGIPVSIIAHYLGHTELMFERTYRHLLLERKAIGYDMIRNLPDSEIVL